MKKDSNVLTGVNSDFVAIFSSSKQMYEVFYKGKLLITKTKYSEVKSYLI
jgi:hypothetical protein